MASRAVMGRLCRSSAGLCTRRTGRLAAPARAVTTHSAQTTATQAAGRAPLRSRLVRAGGQARAHGWWSTLGATGFAVLAPSAAVICEGSGDDASGGAAVDLPAVIGKQINEALQTGIPAQVSWGVIAGFSTGFTIKKVSKVAAVMVGTGFILIQSLAYGGYVKVDWTQFERDMVNSMDLNHDGKVDQEDLAIMQEQALKVLKYNMPAGSGFGVGLVLGLRQG